MPTEFGPTGGEGLGSTAGESFTGVGTSAASEGMIGAETGMIGAETGMASEAQLMAGVEASSAVESGLAGESAIVSEMEASFGMESAAVEPAVNGTAEAPMVIATEAEAAGEISGEALTSSDAIVEAVEVQPSPAELPPPEVDLAGEIEALSGKVPESEPMNVEPAPSEPATMQETASEATAIEQPPETASETIEGEPANHQAEAVAEPAETTTETEAAPPPENENPEPARLAEEAPKLEQAAQAEPAERAEQPEAAAERPEQETSEEATPERAEEPAEAAAEKPDSPAAEPEKFVTDDADIPVVKDTRLQITINAEAGKHAEVTVEALSMEKTVNYDRQVRFPGVEKTRILDFQTTTVDGVPTAIIEVKDGGIGAEAAEAIKDQIALAAGTESSIHEGKPIPHVLEAFEPHNVLEAYDKFDIVKEASDQKVALIIKDARTLEFGDPGKIQNDIEAAAISDDKSYTFVHSNPERVMEFLETYPEILKTAYERKVELQIKLPEQM